MTDERDVVGILLPDEACLTKVGIFVFNLSIDELPQLINVLKGGYIINWAKTFVGLLPAVIFG